MSTSRVLLASLGLFASACAIRLPPPPTPPRRAPSVALPTDPSPAGGGRIVIETVDGPATAELVTGRATAYGVATSGVFVASRHVAVRRLCTTPCAVDLPRGEHEIILTLPGTNRVGRVVARVEERPAVLVASLGERTSHPGKLISGVVVLSTGVPLLLAGAGVSAFDDDAGTASYVALGVGLGMTAIGTLLVYSARNRLQDPSYAQYPID